jgi:hypothetical protein
MSVRRKPKHASTTIRPDWRQTLYPVNSRLISVYFAFTHSLRSSNPAKAALDWPIRPGQFYGRCLPTKRIDPAAGNLFNANTHNLLNARISPMQRGID